MKKLILGCIFALTFSTPAMAKKCYFFPYSGKTKCYYESIEEQNKEIKGIVGALTSNEAYRKRVQENTEYKPLAPVEKPRSEPARTQPVPVTRIPSAKYSREFWNKGRIYQNDQGDVMRFAKYKFPAEFFQDLDKYPNSCVNIKTNEFGILLGQWCPLPE